MPMRVPAPRSRRFADSAADTLVKDKATPFVVIFEMVDTHKERQDLPSRVHGRLGEGWIQKPDEPTDMKGTESRK